MSETRLQGRSASPGLAAGPVVLLAATRAAARAALDPAAAAEALRRAIGRAAGEIAALAETSEPAAADMLGFQLALLEDDALAEGAFHAISLGVAADAAWQQALDAEIAGYEAAEDEYFRARAADLMDVRDRVLDALAGGGEGTPAAPPAATGIVAAHDLPPSRFLGMDWSSGGAILLAGGSPTSHVAMLARSRGIPMIVGLGVAPEALVGEVLVDATAGAVVIDPSPETRRAFERQREQDGRRAAVEAAGALGPAVTRDGTAIAVLLNVADPAELDGLDPALCDGIGLVRTEFLFHDAGSLPGEEAQLAVYARLLAWACRDGRARPVTIRTLDAGGDKPIAGLTVDGESNPFLGVRGIRLSLAREDVFRVQLRALLRAAAGPGGAGLKVMLPMVTVPAEVARTRAMLAQERAALAAAGIPAALPALGIMIEVPAAAIAIDLFEADFYSVGSNDLTQYVTAAGRDIGAVADLADPHNPAVLRLVEQVARDGAARGREVSLCGDAGGDPAVLPALLRAGLRALSMAPGLVPAAKAAIRAAALSGGPGR